MTDGSKWKQAEYHYEYHYAYRPEATVTNDGLMLVDGMSRAVRVRRVYGRDGARFGLLKWPGLWADGVSRFGWGTVRAGGRLENW
jgi:hypothetical protein